MSHPHRKTKRVKQRKKTGRPSSVTPERIAKLEHAFSIGGNVTEACLYAQISLFAYYRFVGQNEEFRNRFELLRCHPSLRAKSTIFAALSHDTALAWKYLERKYPEEYGVVRKREDTTERATMKIIFEDQIDDH